jgi:hypothetical protein
MGLAGMARIGQESGVFVMQTILRASRALHRARGQDCLRHEQR